MFAQHHYLVLTSGLLLGMVLMCFEMILFLGRVERDVALLMGGMLVGALVVVGW